MKQISLCRFCGDGLENRGLVQDGGDASPLLILRYDDKEAQVDFVKNYFPDATIAYRFACADAPDFSKAMLGCGFFVRTLIRGRRLVMLPVEYGGTFFGITELGLHELQDGSWVYLYVKIDVTMMAEYERVKKGP